MNGTSYEALVVLVVGMLTVFVILSLVVLSGRLLLLFLNRSSFVFNKAKVKAAALRAPTDPTKRKLIEKAIQKWSEGQAKVITVDSD
jgi:hypothetical protein